MAQCPLFEADQDSLSRLHRKAGSVQPGLNGLTGRLAVGSLVGHSSPVPEIIRSMSLRDPAEYRKLTSLPWHWQKEG